VTTEPVYIIAGTRTAIGDFGGALKDFAPAQLGSLVVAEAIRRAGIAPADVQNVVLGQVIQSEPKDAYIARVAAINAGVPVETPALTLNRLCGSGIEAIITATKGIALGEASIAVAGGAESMSRAPYVLTSHVRDTAVWNTPQGAAVAWTRMGEGNIGMEDYIREYAAKCPGRPLSLEVIVTGPRNFNYRDPKFWEAYRTTPAWEFARFLALAEKGTPKEAPPRLTGEAAQAKEREDLEKSIAWTKEFLAKL